MQMNRVALLASAGFGIAFLAACSDSPMAPRAATKVDVAPPSFALLAQPTNFPTSPNTITVCSAVASATFSVTFNNALGSKQIPPLVGAGPYTLAVAANSCATIWSKTNATSAPDDDITTATVVQTGQAAGYQFKMVEVGGELSVGGANNGTKTATLSANAFHGATATFTQELIPVVTGCTYTKGWYRNNGSNTVTMVDGRSKADAQKIFDATPGKPGGVTWQGGNDVLNLYQQLLAALLNGGAGSGITAVTNAITAAQAGTGGSGLAITTNLTQAQVSALINTLSSFNEGSFTGFPHCG